MSELVMQCYKKVGLEATVRFLDNLKNLGFAEATKAALSMGVCDVRIPANKQKIIEEAHKRVDSRQKAVRRRDHHRRGTQIEDHQYLDRSFRSAF